MPNIRIQNKAEELSENVLPPNCHTWLEFYDRLKPEMQQENGEIVWSQTFTPDEYMYQFGRWPEAVNLEREVILAGRIKRDFMLARIAEQLLPARLDMSALDELRRKQYKADSYQASEAYRDSVSYLEPLFKVARPK
jgi:hypothetical protein